MSKLYLSCFEDKKIGKFDSFWGNYKSNLNIYSIINHIFILGDICAICQNTKKTKAKTDCCSHTFCYSCILSWCQIRNICPLCKRTIMKLDII